MPALPPQVVMKTTRETWFILLIIICGYLQEDRGKGGQWVAICFSLGIQTYYITLSS